MRKMTDRGKSPNRGRPQNVALWSAARSNVQGIVA